MKYVLGLDLGTSYFKALIVDEKGCTAGLSRIKTPAVSKQNLCTVSPKDFRDALSDILREALHRVGASSNEIAGVSYASQANSFILLDESYEPLTDLILWPDAGVETADPVVTRLWNHPDTTAAAGTLGANQVSHVDIRLPLVRPYRGP